jgi:glycosyltransferase involved in cell wall biosynthesis
VTTNYGGWVCCHLGAREHYAVPRALQRRGRLAQLITDAWARPGTWYRRINGGAFGRLAQRYHDDLANAPVRALTSSLIGREVLWRIQQREKWDLLMARNEWFQERAADLLPSSSLGPGIVFAHSYSAAGILESARQRGWMTVLGQIDPGPRHYRLQEQLAAGRGEYGPAPMPPPAGYFDSWRRECDAADHIVVNSDWSRDSLMDAGIDPRKIVVVPLPYEPDRDAAPHTRAYPAAFSASRRMRVLFVGAASVVKGAADLLDAFVSLDDPRMELHLVGDRVMSIPDRLAAHPRINWVGPVDRLRVMEHYRSSDVLVFPSHSDGFGMAQVEARAWALPIIASRHCGRVIDDGQTGILLDVVSASSIATALRHVVEEPSTLAGFSEAMQKASTFGLEALADMLVSLEYR